MNVELTSDVPRDLVDLAASRAGCTPTEVGASPVPYAFGSPATAGLWEVRAGTEHWCVKRIQHPSHWPGLALMPPPVAEHFVREFPWRFELDMELSGIGRLMPPGMRTARLDHVDTPDDEHATLWWEWIDDPGTTWTQEQYVLAARSLGRLAARRREGAPANDTLPALCREVPTGYALRMYVGQRTLGATVPALRGPGLRDQPAVAAALDAVGPSTWDDMLALADRIPAMLDELDELPQTFAHGDASPQNLLRPSAEPGTLVAIDWGFGSLLAVGFDLGQLVVGLVHAGLARAASLPELVRLVVPAYAAGLADEGWPVPQDVVQRGFALSVQCRSALDSLPFERLSDEPDDALVELLVERLRLSQALLALPT